MVRFSLLLYIKMCCGAGTARFLAATGYRYMLSTIEFGSPFLLSLVFSYVLTTYKFYFCNYPMRNLITTGTATFLFKFFRHQHLEILFVAVARATKIEQPGTTKRGGGWMGLRKTYSRQT